jgi:hypothetical protein
VTEDFASLKVAEISVTEIAAGVTSITLGHQQFSALLESG